MTQEEKLEEAKRLYETANADQKYVLESLFPELKESEKIRNTIFDCLYKCCDSGVITREQRHICIAWLEKQCEQKIKTPEESLGIDSDTYNKIVDECIYGEQKPIDKVEPNFKVGDLIKLSKEPKYPAREIISIKNDGYYFDSAVYLPFERQNDWELVEQEPDWSEEDEKQARQIERIVHDGCTQKLQKQIADWFKSLKERCNWKPSDEQINTLEYYMHALVCNEHKEILFGLYSDLKELRGE